MVNFIMLIKEKIRRSVFSKGNESDGVAVYNLKCCPITFDFAYFLYQAEIFFLEKGVKNFYVVIVDGQSLENREYKEIIDENRQRKRIEAILLPMAEMYRAVEKVLVCSGDVDPVWHARSPGAYVFPRFATNKHLRSHSYKKIFHYNKEGRTYSGFSAPETSKKAVGRMLSDAGIVSPIVVLTVRDYGYQPLRNTSLPVYIKFAEWLKSRGYHVVFVPDADANSSSDFGRGYVCRKAAEDIFFRVALSEQAICTVFTSNGLHALCALNHKTSYIIASYVNESYPESTGLQRYQGEGLSWGDQPFTENNSVVVWDKETVSNLKNAFLQISSKV